MNIILIDAKVELAKKHAATLGRSGQTVWYWDVNEAKQWDGSKFAGAAVGPSAYEVALVHLGDVQSLDVAAPSCRRIVIYSGGGNARHAVHPCIKLPVGIDRPIPSEVLHRICQWASVGITEDEWRKGIEELFNDEPLMAFRLLCEAWQIAKIDKNSGCEGITINAPEVLEQWLTPFGKRPDEEDAIEHVAGMIGSGKIKAKAKAVLESVTGNGDALKTAIEKFLQDAAKPSA